MEQVEAIWAAHATRHAYDAAGHRISTTDALGHRTVFFNDDEGRVRYAVNAAGGVTENQYDTLGRVVSVARYAGAVAAAALADLAGGALSDAAVAVLAAAAAAAPDQNSITRTAYDANGQAVQTTDARGAVSRIAYDAFGAVVRTTEPGTVGGSDVTTVNTYDRRGLQTGMLRRSDKMYVAASKQYDAFGRITRTVDFNGNQNLQNYDRLGRVVQTTDAANGIRKVSYDAFGRVLTTIDALNNTTTYSYNTAERSTTMVTAGQVTSVTRMNRAGQVHSITDGNGNTTVYHYDQDGRLTETVRPLGGTANEYDAAGRLAGSTDAEGNEVVYTYDAANRVLTRTVDPDGLKLQTRYEYDAMGQQVRSTDASGTVTVTTYDLNGGVLTQTVDPDGLRLGTRYAHDARGNVVSVTDAGGTRTDYVYDDLGRRIRTVTDPAGLNLVQAFAYDNNGNMVASVDANGNRTRYAYDTLNRLVYTVDPAGYVTHNAYDAENRVARTTVYAKALKTANLGATASVATIAAQIVVTATQDTVRHHVYNKDGRLIYDVDGQGGVTAYQVDGNGNVTSRLTYATRINMGGWTAGTVPAVTADALRDQLVRTVYDGLNRPVYTIDGTGAVARMVYDDNGNVIERIAYAGTIAAATPATAAAIGAALAAVADTGRDLHTRYTYDHAGRLVWEVDGLGRVTGNSYDEAGNLVKQVKYAGTIAAGADPASVVAGEADRVTLKGYDAVRRLVVEVDQAGTVRHIAYDANGNVLVRTTLARPVARPHAGSGGAAELAAQAEADAGHDQVVRSVYDAANREIFRIDGVGAVTAQKFDANGQVIDMVTYATPVAAATPATEAAVTAAVAAIADAGRDQRTRHVYDPDGMMLWSVSGRDLTAYGYNHMGEVVRRTVYARALPVNHADFTDAALAAAATVAANASQDGVDILIYDKDNHLVWKVDGSGAATQYTYDVAGNLTAQVTYAKRINVAALPPGQLPSVVADAVHDIRSFRIYDAANRLEWTVDGTGAVSHYDYDGKDQVIAQTVYANRIDMAAWVTGKAPAVVADAARDLVQRTVYDADGRPVYGIDGAGYAVAYTYGDNGKVVEQTRYAIPLPAGTPATVQAVAAALSPDSARDVHARYAYDSADRVELEADSMGHVRRYSYDVHGNVVKLVRYTTPVAAGAALDSVPASASDRVTLMAYDADNRLVCQVEENGQVSRQFYDAKGNIVKRVSYAQRIARPAADSAATTTEAIAALVAGDAANDQVALSIYDHANREIYSIDPRGMVKAYQYDGKGLVTEQVAYAGAIAVPAQADAASVAAAVAAVADAARDDRIRNLYDQAGRVQWSVNSAGDITNTTYTASGKVATAVTYLRRATPATQMTVAALGSAVAGAAADARHDYVYDGANRLIWTVDGTDGAVNYRYDGAGNEIERVTYRQHIVRNLFVPGTVPAVAADIERDSTLRTVYDARQRPVYTVDGGGNVVAMKYDLQGNVVERIAYAAPIAAATPMTAAAIGAAVQLGANGARDVRSTGVYDLGGRLLWASDEQGKVTAYTYDAEGNIVKQVSYATPLGAGAAPQDVPVSAADRATLTAYDIERRPVASVDERGEVTTYQYDARGNLVERRTYANRIARPGASSVPLDAAFAAPAASAADRVVRSVFDAAGRELFRIDELGALTAWRYSGNAVERIGYATVVPADTPATKEALSAALALVADPARDTLVRETYDGGGLLATSTNANGGVTRFSYDANGNLIERATPDGKLFKQVFDCTGQLVASIDGDGARVSYAYDSRGLLINRTVFGVKTSAINWYAVPDAAGQDDVQVRTVYDAAGRPLYTVDNYGNVTEQRYDARGNVVERITYAARIPGNTPATAKALAAALAPLANARADLRERNVYDANDRLAYRVDGNGGVTSYSYDARGNLLKQVQHATPIAYGADPATAPASAADRVNLMAYDQEDRLVYAVDAEGTVRHQQFDNAGNLLKLTIYAGKIDVAAAAAAAVDIAAIGARVSAQPGVDRVSHQSFDVANRLIYSVDALGVVQKNRYDALGNLLETTQYANRVSGLASYDTAGLDGSVVADALNDRTGKYRYNAMGAVVWHEDALGATETTTYNSSGQKDSFTDKNGGVWNYSYDAAGRQFEETSPVIAGKNGNYRKVTRTQYDGAGRLVGTSETGGGESYGKTFTYDSQGNQTSVNFGKFKDYRMNVAAAGQTDVAVSRIDYNGLGKAVRTIDVDGYVSNSVYDANGQLRYEIDAKGQVTGYARNVFGEVTALTRYAGAITLNQAGLPDTAGMEVLLAALDHSQDRTITTSYDLMGRVLDVVQPATYVLDPDAADPQQRALVAGLATRKVYDAFGDLVQVATLSNPLAGKWSVVNNYYDQRGQLTATVDGDGYLTTHTYDNAGNNTGTVESAVAIAGWSGNRDQQPVALADARDRIATNVFDRGNRLVRQSVGDGAQLANNEHVRVNEFDALGHTVRTRAWGPGASGSDAVSRMFYDALGRVTAVIDATRPVGNGYGLTTYVYDVFGNVVSETRYAQGSLAKDQPLPAAPGAEDRTSVTEYDQQGHAVLKVDAEGIKHYVTYNRRGLQTAQWVVGTGIAGASGIAFASSTRSYDALGRMLSDSATGEVNQYNAFGELVRQQHGGQVATFDYDVAGRLWRSNDSGTEQVRLYDLQGRVSALISSAGKDFGDRDLRALTSASEVADAGDVRRTDYRYDLAGNLVGQIDPERDGVRPALVQTFDRWGNVLSKTAAAPAGMQAPTTSFTYDMRNTVTSERHARADGSEGGRVREFLYVYGAQGAMVSRQTIDRDSADVSGPAANSAVRARWRVVTETFTATGKLLQSETNGLVSERHTYDVFDQMRTDGLQDASLARYTYNRRGQVVTVSHDAVAVHTVNPTGNPLTLSSLGSKVLTERYQYDELGYLASVTNGAGDITRYQHDVLGNVTSVDNPITPPLVTTWDTMGHKLSATDAFGNKASWTYDSYGRMATATGYDGSVTVYAYDNAGQLISGTQASKGQVVSYTYDRAGQTVGISDICTGAGGAAAGTKLTTYGYDLAGNRVREITVHDGRVFQDNTQVFDVHHRLVTVRAEDSYNGSQTISYEYDGFGNRTRFTSVAPGKDGQRNENGWFFYDALNRMTISGALDAAGAIGGATVRRVFDAAGNLESSTVGGRSEQYAYDAMNRLVRTSVNGVLAFTTSYDAAGRVVAEAMMVDAPPEIPSGMAKPVEPVKPVAPPPPPAGSPQATIDLYNQQKAQYDLDLAAYNVAKAKYDADLKDYNDQQGYLTGLRNTVSASTGYERHLRGYDAQGRLIIDQSLKDDGSVKSLQYNDSFDAAGNALTYHTESFVNDRIRSNFTNTYRTIVSGVVQAGSSGRMSVLTGKLGGKTGDMASTTLIYDATGNLVGVNFTTSGKEPPTGPKKKVFITDAEGHILLSREEDHNSPTQEQHQIIVNGVLHLRYSTHYGSFNDLEDEQEDAFWKAYNDRISQSMLSPGGRVEPGQGASSGQVVVVQEGDTLSSLAQRVYGDADMWFRLADANDIEPGAALQVGRTLVVPGTAADDTGLTFDNGKLIGSTAPNLPSPPPDSNKCITILIVVVAVIVSFYLGPVALAMAEGAIGAGLGATVLAGAATGAVASLASQGVAIAAGVQDGINWKGVGMGALGGAVGAGVGYGANGLTGVAHAVATSVITQGLGVALHMQKKFSWAAVAGAAVGAAVTQGLMPEGAGSNSKALTNEQFGEGFVRGGLAGLARGLTTDLLTPGKQNYADIAINAFGDAIGGGLEQQRKYNHDHNLPYYGDGMTNAVKGWFEPAKVQSVNGVGSSVNQEGREPGSAGNPIVTENGDHLILGKPFVSAIGIDDQVGGESVARGMVLPKNEIALDSDGAPLLASLGGGGAMPLSPAEVENIRANRVAKIASETSDVAKDLVARISDPKNNFVDYLNRELQSSGPESQFARLLPEQGDWFSGTVNREQFAKAFGTTANNADALGRFMRGENVTKVGDVAVNSNVRSILASNQLATSDFDLLSPSTWESMDRTARDNFSAASVLRQSGVIDAPVYRELTGERGIAHAMLRPYLIGGMENVPIVAGIRASVDGLEAASLVDEIRGMVGGLKNPLIQDAFARAVNLVIKAEDKLASLGLKALRVAKSADKVADTLKTGPFVEQAVEFVAKASNLFDKVEFKFADSIWNGKLLAIRNNSDHGIDFIGRTVKDDKGVQEWVPIEVKGSVSKDHTGLSKEQAKGANWFTRNRLNRAENREGAWKSAPADTHTMAATIRREQGMRPYVGYVISANNVGSANVKTVMFPWTANAKAPK